MYMLYVYNMLQYNKNGYNDNIKNGLTDILSSFILLYYIIESIAWIYHILNTFIYYKNVS